jgi:transcriptional regulator with XRE-family HTH domain
MGFQLDVKAVRILMIQRDIENQKELAKLIGYSQNTVVDLLSGKRQPTLETLGALCRVLGCSADQILTESKDEPNTQSLTPAGATEFIFA